MPQNVPGSSSRREAPLKRWLIPDMETWSPSARIQHKNSLCPSSFYLHQNLGISDLPQPADASDCLKFRNYKWLLIGRTADYRLRVVLSFLMPCPTKPHLQFLSDWNGKIRHPLLGNIIAEQNDPLFPNSPSKNGFVLLWGFLFIFFLPNSHFPTKSQVHDYFSGKAANKTLRQKSWTLSCISKHHRFCCKDCYPS